MVVSIPREELVDLYEKQKYTTYQVAKKFNCCQATIWKKLVEFGIKRRSPHELNSNIPSKEELIKYYIRDKLSTWQIEKKYGYCRSTIHRKLKEAGIVRDRATAHIIFPRKNFSGNLVEKAYLIGFKIGDLGVRKIHPNSKSICVASGSTIKEQIDLIENLFEKYGHIWIKEKNNKINIQTSLNESFDFLLSKEVPPWVTENKQTFFSFLAGFVDAEGHIGVYKNMAILSIGNYNFKILNLIYENLLTHGISCNKVFSDKRKGKLNSQGYPYRSNYWSFRVHKKDELLKLLYQIKPYLKHKNKIKDLNIAIENINYRNKLKLLKNEK